MTTKKLFIEKALKELNKSSNEILEQRVSDFAEDSANDAEEDIALIKSKITKINTTLKRSKRELAKAEMILEKSYYKVPEDFSFDTYKKNLEKVMNEIFNLKLDIEHQKGNLRNEKHRLSLYQKILNTLKS